MASTVNENLPTSVDQQESTTDTKNVPIYNASTSHQHSHACNDPSHHHHHYPPMFDHDDQHLSSIGGNKDMLAKRKAKKNPKQDVTRAELIPGHQGDKNIDDLLNFINGSSTANNNNGSKKSKKKVATNN